MGAQSTGLTVDDDLVQERKKGERKVFQCYFNICEMYSLFKALSLPCPLHLETMHVKESILAQKTLILALARNVDVLLPI